MAKKIFYKEYLCKHKPIKNASKIQAGDRLASKSELNACLKNKIFSKKHRLLKLIIIDLNFDYLRNYYIIILFKMNKLKKGKILSNFSACLDNIHSFYNPFNLSKFLFLIFYRSSNLRFNYNSRRTLPYLLPQHLHTHIH